MIVAPIEVETVRQSLTHGEMFLEYLPVMCLVDNRCVGAEALVRWRHGSVVIMPDDFIPAIENTPLSGALTYWVIETVAQELGAWLREHNDAYIGINVPPEILGRGGMEYAVVKAGVGDMMSRFVLEITERSVPDRLGIDGLNAAARNGIRVALDDVGTHGVNLAILCRAHIGMIKLDKTFLNQICLAGDDGMATLTRILHAISVDVVVEGVESAEQVAVLKAVGVKYVQGFYFSPPLAAKDFHTFYLAHG